MIRRLFLNGEPKPPLLYATWQLMNTQLIELLLMASMQTPMVTIPQQTLYPEVGKPQPQVVQTIEIIPKVQIEPLKEIAPIPPKPPKPIPKPVPKPVAKPKARGNSAGNTYTPGNCTWYVKSRRSDIPNNLGNANTWTTRARNQGIPTGTTPRPGAVGQKGMHVVYVESVNGSQMTISEMNYRKLYQVSSRTVSSAGWNFIY